MHVQIIDVNKATRYKAKTSGCKAKPARPRLRTYITNLKTRMILLMFFWQRCHFWACEPLQSGLLQNIYRQLLNKITYLATSSGFLAQGKGKGLGGKAKASDSKAKAKAKALRPRP